MLGDHWLLGKDGFFPQAFHVPLIVVDPSAEAVPRPGGRGVHRARRPDADDPRAARARGAAAVRRPEPRAVARGRDARRLARRRRTTSTTSATSRRTSFERALGLPSDRCALAVRQSAGYAYVHFNGLPPLCYDLARGPAPVRDIAARSRRAPEVLAQAQAMLTWRMDMAERRLTGCKLTPAGVIGRF